MADGIGCKCSARCWTDCACGVDWTSSEVIKLRGLVLDALAVNPNYTNQVTAIMGRLEKIKGGE